MGSNATRGITAIFALTTAFAAQAAVVNGTFETGDFSGWTVAGAAGFTGVDGSAARSGSFGAYFGEDTPGSSIEQVLATIAGRTYKVDFWLQLDDSATPNSFSWEWDGVTQSPVLSDAGAFGYSHFGSLVRATTASSSLRFNFLNQQSFYLLDDVNVQLPEPGSTALALLALAALGATSLRKVRSVSGAPIQPA